MGLVKVMKEAKKEGQETRLIYDKLYINGRGYRPNVTLHTKTRLMKHGNLGETGFQKGFQRV